MTKEEWRVFHGFDEEEMERIDLLVKLTGGTITAIFERAKNAN